MNVKIKENGNQFASFQEINPSTPEFEHQKSNLFSVDSMLLLQITPLTIITEFGKIENSNNIMRIDQSKIKTRKAEVLRTHIYNHFK